MSHFTVLCIGDVENAMQPYSTANEEYYKKRDRTELILKEWDEFKKGYADVKNGGKGEGDYDEKFLSYYIAQCGEKLEQMMTDICEFASFFHACNTDDGGKTFYEWNNPDAFYDYYDDGYGTGVNEILFVKGCDEPVAAVERSADLDVVRMVAHTIETFGDDYDEVVSAIGHTPAVTYKWRELMENVGKGLMTMQEARDMYTMQTDVTLFNNLCGFRWLGGGVEDYACSREEFIERKAYIPFIKIVSEYGHFKELGSIGWFGVMSEDTSRKEWFSEQVEVLREIMSDYPDARITTVDCHI